MITVHDRGTVYGPYLTDTRDARYAATIATYPALSQALPTTTRITIGNTWLSTVTSPLFVPGIQFRSAHNYQLYNQGTLIGFWQGSPSSTAQPTFPTGIVTAGTLRSQQDYVLAAQRPTLSAFAVNPLLANGSAAYATWYSPGVTNKAIYDYTSINALGMNYGTLGAKTYNVELQQEITSNLHLDVGWFRQEIQQTDNYAAGEANQQFSLYADTNQLMPDGSANPFLGSPTEFDYSQDTFQRPEINNNWRVMLAYELDFTKHSNWTRWFGHHRIMGLWSRQEDIIQNLRYRLSVDGGDTRFMPNNYNVATAGIGFPANGSLFDRWYYLGQNPNGIVQYSTGFVNTSDYGGIGSASANTYNFLTHTEDSASVNFDPNLYLAGSNYLQQKVLESENLAWQGYFWKDRIVATVGWRKDNFRSRQTDLTGVTASQTYTNGITNAVLVNRLNNYSYLSGRTKTAGVVARPFIWSWGSLGAHLNRSDNFNPPSSVQYDYFGNRLGKPQGKGKDYGIDLTLFDNKLVARLNWFQSDNQNAVATQASTAAGRVTLSDTTNMRGWAEWVVRYRSGEDTTSNFANNNIRPLTAQQITDIQTLMQDPNYSYQNNGWPTGWRASTQENKSKGLEGQLIYNPMPQLEHQVHPGQAEVDLRCRRPRVVCLARPAPAHLAEC